MLIGPSTFYLVPEFTLKDNICFIPVLHYTFVRKKNTSMSRCFPSANFFEGIESSIYHGKYKKNESLDFFMHAAGCSVQHLKLVDDVPN